jgi:hypothetical protein
MIIITIPIPYKELAQLYEYKTQRPASLSDVKEWLKNELTKKLYDETISVTQ